MPKNWYNGTQRFKMETAESIGQTFEYKTTDGRVFGMERGVVMRFVMCRIQSCNTLPRRRSLLAVADIISFCKFAVITSSKKELLLSATVSLFSPSSSSPAPLLEHSFLTNSLAVEQVYVNLEKRHYEYAGCFDVTIGRSRESREKIDFDIFYT